MANRGRVEHSLGYLHHYRGNWNISIAHLDRAYRYYSRANDPLNMAKMDLNQGENYRNKGELKRAWQLYRACYDTAKSLDNLQLMAMAMTNEGLVLTSMNDPVNARKAFNKGYQLTERWTEQFEIRAALRCEILQGIATLDLRDGDLDGAWEAANIALDEAEQAINGFQMGYAYRILGDVITALGEAPMGTLSDNPDAYYRQSIRVFQQMEVEGEVARTYFAQAKSYIKRGKTRLAAKTLQAAMRLFTQLGMTNDATLVAETQLAITR